MCVNVCWLACVRMMCDSCIGDLGVSVCVCVYVSEGRGELRVKDDRVRVWQSDSDVMRLLNGKCRKN